MCYTGLRYSDAIRFNSSLHIVGGKRIVVVTQKTKKETNLYINDKIRPLADFVNDHRIYITQIDFNRKLKVIAAGAGINKNVSSHVARHSFGSSLVDLGITIEVAKGLLSHGSTSSIKIYYHLKSANLDEAMKKFNK
jgi:integrase/recombinase XerD